MCYCCTPNDAVHNTICKDIGVTGPAQKVYMCVYVHMWVM